MISQVWICKCDFCGVETRAVLAPVERDGLLHYLPDSPEGWQCVCGKINNNHHICPECWAKFIKEAANAGNN